MQQRAVVEVSIRPLTLDLIDNPALPRPDRVTERRRPLVATTCADRRRIFNLKTRVGARVPERQTSLARFLETCYHASARPSSSSSSSSVHFRWLENYMAYRDWTYGAITNDRNVDTICCDAATGRLGGRCGRPYINPGHKRKREKDWHHVMGSRGLRSGVGNKIAITPRRKRTAVLTDVQLYMESQWTVVESYQFSVSVSHYGTR